MPVNFETPDPGIIERPYVQQIPLEALFKNLGYKQAKYDQAAQKIQADVDGLMITAYGQDLEKRNQIIGQVNQQLSKFAGMDMSDPNVQSQISSFIGQVSSSPDLLGIKMRSSAYEKAMAKKEKLTADGKTVISPRNDGTMEMERYYAGAEPYNPNRRFKGDVFVDYDFNALDKVVAEATPELEELNRVGKYDELSKGKTKGALANNWVQALKNNPAAERDLRAQFEEISAGQNYGDIDRYDLYKTMENMKNVFSQYQSLANAEQAKVNPNPALLSSYQQKATQAQMEYAQASDHYNNVNDATSAQHAWEAFKGNKAEKFANSHVSYATKSRTLDRQEELAIQLQNDLTKIGVENEGRIELAKAKGQIPKDIDGASAEVGLEQWKEIKAGLHDSSGEAAGFLFGTNTKTDWDQTDFNRTFNIKSGLSGKWKPVQNLSIMNDLFGATSQSSYDSESGTLVKTGGKVVTGTFRNPDTGEVVVILNEDGQFRPVVITDNEIKDKVLQRLKGKNYEKYHDAITNYDLSNGATSTGATGSSASTGSQGATGQVGPTFQYDAKDSSTTFQFK